MRQCGVRFAKGVTGYVRCGILCHWFGVLGSFKYVITVLVMPFVCHSFRLGLEDARCIQVYSIWSSELQISDMNPHSLVFMCINYIFFMTKTWLDQSSRVWQSWYYKNFYKLFVQPMFSLYLWSSFANLNGFSYLLSIQWVRPRWSPTFSGYHSHPGADLQQAAASAACGCAIPSCCCGAVHAHHWSHWSRLDAAQQMVIWKHGVTLSNQKLKGGRKIYSWSFDTWISGVFYSFL